MNKHGNDAVFLNLGSGADGALDISLSKGKDKSQAQIQSEVDAFVREVDQWESQRHRQPVEQPTITKQEARVRACMNLDSKSQWLLSEMKRDAV